MDLEILEALALSADRPAALAQLLPGSADHDYYRCVHAQHAGRLDDADRIIDAWAQRHGHDDRYTRLQLRQMIYRLGQDPEQAADDVRDRFGVSHWHEAEVAEVDPSRPTRLAPGTFDGATLLQQGVEYSADLSQVTDEGLYELLGTTLDTSRRRALLGRIAHTPQPEVVRWIAEDLAERSTGGFGSLRIHDELALDQLHALAKLRPDLRTQRGWIDAVVKRMRPPATVDLVLDRDAREAYLVELWGFVRGLSAPSNSLKAHVLWHLLDAQRRRDAAPDPALFAAYLSLPRNAAYAPTGHRVSSDELAQVGIDLRATTGLPPAGGDEELVRDLLHRRIGDAERYARWLDRTWLDAEIATANLLAGTGDADRATLVLGPARAAALRERIDLAWCLHNPTRFGTGEPIVLEAEVKHVPELVVNVFRVDPLAYFQHQHREVSAELDLDGLAASHELVMKFAEPPIRRVRRRIELPMCARAGTYVIDLIGNGMSSRAVVHKGRLRHLARIGAAGHVVTILDEAGRPMPGASGARAWVGDREYTPDERGTFTVPFSTARAILPMLLVCGDVASVAHLELVREDYALGLHLVLDRQALTAGRTARAIARLGLSCGGAPASLALLEQASWDITLTDRHGVATTKSQPLELVDDDATVLEWPLGEDTAAIAVAIRGRVKVISQQRELELSRTEQVSVAEMYNTTATEALYLAHTATGWVVSALGKSGEPRAQRPVSIVLVHRWSRIQLTVELATDARGRVELGELPGLARISATLGSATQHWTIDEPDTWRAPIHARAGKDIVIGIPAVRTATEVARRVSLVEMRGGAPMRHLAPAIRQLESAIAIDGLAPGTYVLHAPGIATGIRVVDVADDARHAVLAGEIVELSRRAPAIAEIAIGDAITIRLVDATPHTRVHAIATPFRPAPVARWAAHPGHVLPPQLRDDRARAATYVSGRELGDEYRYILDRRSAKRFPGLLLEKPSLLLNPWARRTTTTDVAAPRAGGAFAAPAPSMAASGYGGSRQAGPGLVNTDALVGYDFLGAPPVVIANLVPSDGAVVLPRAELGTATEVTIIVDDPAGATLRHLALAEPALAPRDLRLKLALDPARHATQRKAIQPLRAGDQLVIEDLATAKVHLIDSVERAHAYLLALGDDPTLRELAWVTRWHVLADIERRELYSKYACHELHLFLYFKDRTFFDAVVRPYLAHKRTKTFVDHWLLDDDLAPYLEPATLARLNAVERALLARRLRAEPALVRLLADEVALLPPDPAIDTRLVDALLGASTLEAGSELDGLLESAKDKAESRADITTETAAFAQPPPPMARPAPAPQAAARSKKLGRRAEADLDDEGLGDDLRRRSVEAPMFRVVDRTQEWAENNWWHLLPAQSGPEMIAVNRLWRDLARDPGDHFLSPWLGLATGSFAEAMCALAVIDLPFVAVAHTLAPDGPRLTITAAGNALAGTSQLVDGELVTTGAPLVVGQSYVRTDDRYDWVDGEQLDKYVEGPFAAGVVYTCQVVLANPTSSRQRVAALIQIPRGSIAVSGARATDTIDVLLPPYGTHGHEVAFYFPSAGRFAHFPVHVSRSGEIVAAAPATPIEVTPGGAAADPTSWPHLSQHGSLAEVCTYLDTANLAAIDLERAAWRLRDRAAYTRILGVLEKRRAYDPALWGYALYHRDRPRIRVWLRSLGDVLSAAGPVLETIDLDSEQLGTYEHLEHAPLVNARAHRLGPKLRILNDGLAAQYRRFLELVAHRPVPTTEDLLAAASYLVAQDRAAPAIETLARVAPGSVAERMQHDYLAAYAACLDSQPARAREAVVRWRDLPVDRWRRKFEALGAMLDELDGSVPQIVDPQSRDQQQADLAAKQPAFELAVDRDGVVIRHQHVTALELRFFEMDVELLFSRQPFVQSDVSRFSYIEPGHREQLANPPAEHRLAWPAKLRGKNVVVEAIGAGQRKAKIHYANDLATQVAHQYGQVRVQRASDRAALVATYVKVYARQQGGAIAFYKDGYTDLRGWFDYATLSTDDLDRVERFAILVCSDQAGSAILEASPPAR